MTLSSTLTDVAGLSSSRERLGRFAVSTLTDCVALGCVNFFLAFLFLATSRISVSPPGLPEVSIR